MGSLKIETKVQRVPTCSLLLYLHNCSPLPPSTGLPWWSDGKESTRKVGGLGLIPGLRRFLGEENGDPPQYSCLENSMDRGAWWATAHRVANSRTLLSNFHSLTHSLTLLPSTSPPERRIHYNQWTCISSSPSSQSSRVHSLHWGSLLVVYILWVWKL